MRILIPISAWVAAILLINEVPDVVADGATGKRTLPVRLGNGGTAILYVVIHLVALAVVVYMTMGGDLPQVAPLVPAALVLLALRAAAAIRTGVGDRAGMTKAIEATLAVHTVGALWLTGIAVYLFFAAA